MNIYVLVTVSEDDDIATTVHMTHFDARTTLRDNFADGSPLDELDAELDAANVLWSITAHEVTPATEAKAV